MGTARADGVVFDLLMAVMNSVEIWAAAAGDRKRGLEWRDAVTTRMVGSDSYVSYEDLVTEATADVGLPAAAARALFDRWPEMVAWPDAAALSRLELPYGFVTNCSTRLAGIAARRSRLRPAFTLSAEEAGWYKPDARIYQEACRRLGSPPERTLFVAGSTYDAKGARDAGLRASLVARRPDQPLRDPATAVVTSLLEIVDKTSDRA